MEPPATLQRSTGHAIEPVLQEYWGYDSFLPLQREAIDCVLAGQDSLVVLPTGGGKSLCYQAPALTMPGVAIVVSPLISLMKDQVDSLQACGAPAAFINSSLSTAQRREVAEQLRRGELKLLYAAPERLLMEGTISFLKTLDVSFIAIDEAHCVSTWGHDFRPEYTGLAALKRALPGVAVHAYTATAAERVRGDIVRGLGLVNARQLIGSFDRPNLVFRVRRANQKVKQIKEVIDRHQGESGIVYCISRAEVEQMAASLKAVGVKSAPYHAGMSDIARQRNQEAFIQDRIEVIVATVAFGMGIDKPNVRFVIHAGMPKSLEAYVQESGRSGRDGLEAECLLLYSGGDPLLWRRMIDEGEDAAREGALHSLDEMVRYTNAVACRHRTIVEYFGQSLERDNCGACDVCLGELKMAPDPLVTAQKIISCVARLDQRYGVSHTTKVLVGSKEQAILSNGHDQLSTYGLLARERTTAVRDWVEQLVAQGYLQKVGDYAVLHITAAGWQVLRGEVTPQLLAPAEKARGSKSAADNWEGVDHGLFEALRALRAELASEREVPAYVVFGDAALRDMARRRPTTLEGFAQVRGVGGRKLSEFGELFVGAITDYASQHGLATDVVEEPPSQPEPEPDVPRAPNASATEAFRLFREGKSVAEVARELKKAPSTSAGYLQQFLTHHQVIDPSPWVDSATAQRIEEAIEETGTGYLKPIYEHLGGEVSYDEIRIVATCVANRG